MDGQEDERFQHFHCRHELPQCYFLTCFHRSIQSTSEFQGLKAYRQQYINVYLGYRHWCHGSHLLFYERHLRHSLGHHGAVRHRVCYHLEEPRYPLPTNA